MCVIFLLVRFNNITPPYWLLNKLINEFIWKDSAVLLLEQHLFVYVCMCVRNSKGSAVLMKDHISSAVTETTKGLPVVFMTLCNELFKCMGSWNTHTNRFVHWFSILWCYTEKYWGRDVWSEQNRISTLLENPYRC